MHNMVTVSAIEETVAERFSHLFDSGSRRVSTEIMRDHAVKQAIATMRERFHEPLTLQDIADVAQLSPFHFNRVFRSMIGLPPSVYLAAIRIEQAKKLLLTTDLSVTNVCFDVGYKSLGTFTTRFTQFVGTTPTGLRQLAHDEMMYSPIQSLHDLLSNVHVFQNNAHGASVQGTTNVSVPFSGLIFIGIFTDPLPQSQPIGCTLLTASGSYSIPPVPDGQYYLFATALHYSEDFFTSLVRGTKLRSSFGLPISICHGRAKEHAHLTLCPDRWTDPPILVALPWLIFSRLTTRCQIAATS